MYIHLATGQYPVSEADIRAANPNTSFPVPFVAPEQYAVVFPSPAVYDPATQVATEAAPVLTNKGHWEQAWTVANKSAEQIAAELAPVKASKILQINQWRAAANKTFFTYSGKQIACDDLSRSDIDAVAGSISLTGSFPAGFPGAWKAMDNSYIMLPDIDAFKSMYAAMTAQGTTNFGHSQSLKAAVAAAQTVAEVNAVVW